jgi:hypothetical protein
MKFWDAENTMVGWRFGLIVPVLITLLFFDYAMPIGILLAGLAVVFLFFLGLNLSKNIFHMKIIFLINILFYQL